MSKQIKNALKIILFFSIGAAIFILVYKDQDWSKTKDVLINADYTWIIVSLVLGILSHVSRALRWNILIEPLGYKPSFINSFFAVMIMYLSNIAFPRSGEVVRCGVMSKKENIPFSKLLGTVFTERIVDFIMLFILLAIVLVTQADVVSNLFGRMNLNEKFNGLLSSVPFLFISFLIFVSILVLLYYFRKRIKNSKIFQKFKGIFMNFGDGVKSVLKMDKKYEFIAHSIFIWVMYFVMIYVIFWSFDFTEHLSLLTGLTVFVMSAFGMVFPSPGGMGSWHFAVRETLNLYGVDKSDANAFALAAHEPMTFMMIIVGVIAVILLPVVNKSK